MKWLVAVGCAFLLLSVLVRSGWIPVTGTSGPEPRVRVAVPPTPSFPEICANYAVSKPLDSWPASWDEAFAAIKAAVEAAKSCEPGQTVLRHFNRFVITVEGVDEPRCIIPGTPSGKYELVLNLLGPQAVFDHPALLPVCYSFDSKERRVDIPVYWLPRPLMAASLTHEAYHALRFYRDGVVPMAVSGPTDFDSDEVTAHELSLKVLAKLTKGASSAMIESESTFWPDLSLNALQRFEESLGGDKPLGTLGVSTGGSLFVYGTAFKAVERKNPWQLWSGKKLEQYRQINHDLNNMGGG